MKDEFFPLPPLSGSSLNMRNFEHSRTSPSSILSFAGGVTAEQAGEMLRLLGGPRRTVEECREGWAVTDSTFVTLDKTLAVAVARELDRIDPLPGRIYRVGEHGPE